MAGFFLHCERKRKDFGDLPTILETDLFKYYFVICAYLYFLSLEFFKLFFNFKGGGWKTFLCLLFKLQNLRSVS